MAQQARLRSAEADNAALRQQLTAMERRVDAHDALARELASLRAEVRLLGRPGPTSARR